ncbi:MAG: hypothetical protein ABSH04_02560 [Acidimicrobiales bacterium]|jgi:hypothetical protein
MGLFDTLLGRTKPVRANLDNLFALPGAAVTLQVSAGLLPTRKAGVCFKPPAGQPFAEMQAQIEKLLETPDSPPTGPAADDGDVAASGATSLTVRHVGDSFGYRWILVEGGEIDDLATRVHMVHSSLEDGGWSTQLLCSVFGFAPGGDSDAATGALGEISGTGPGTPTEVIDAVSRPVYIVYLAKRGTFYPFAPNGKEQRDTELELRLRSILGSDLPVEIDLSNWFPIWDLPIA